MEIVLKSSLVLILFINSLKPIRRTKSCHAYILYAAKSGLFVCSICDNYMQAISCY